MTIKELNMKLRFVEAVITYILVGVLITAGANFLSFILAKDVEDLKNTLYAVFCAFISGVLLSIFKEIKKNQTPFTKSVTKKLETIAILISCTGLIPELISECVAMLFEQTNKFSFIFDSETMFIILMGMIVGIISEIFNYGTSVQEDVDSIA